MTVLVHFILGRHDLTVLAWFGSIKFFMPVINLPGCRNSLLVEKRGPRLTYSKLLLNGSREAYNGHSREGRYVAALEAELVKHVGGEPLSIVHKLLIQRIIRLQMQLLLFDEKLADGQIWTPHDLRTFSGISSAFKNALKELGFKPAAPPALSLAEPTRPIDASRAQQPLEDPGKVYPQMLAASREP
jgi:hypothetical protein